MSAVAAVFPGRPRPALVSHEPTPSELSFSAKFVRSHADCGTLRTIRRSRFNFPNPSLTSNSLTNASHNERQRDFQEWATTVRDPARKASEGVRRLLESGGKASAEYELAQLPDGRFAIRMSCQYDCGTMSGRACPWTSFDTRQECLDYFLATVRNHFNVERNVTPAQQQARKEMLKLLGGGLFGFIEPAPDLGA